MGTPLDQVTPLTDGIRMMVGLTRNPEIVRASSRKSEVFLRILPTTLECRRRISQRKMGIYGLLVLGSLDPERDGFGSSNCVGGCVHIGRVAGEGEGDLPDGCLSLVECAEGVEDADEYGLSRSYQNGARLVAEEAASVARPCNLYVDEYRIRVRVSDLHSYILS